MIIVKTGMPRDTVNLVDDQKEKKLVQLLRRSAVRASSQSDQEQKVEGIGECIVICWCFRTKEVHTVT